MTETKVKVEIEGSEQEQDIYDRLISLAQEDPLFPHDWNCVVNG